MKNHFLFLSILLACINSSIAQDFEVVGDVAWNSQPNTYPAGYPDQGTISGRMKQLNDSTYVYISNRTNSQGNELYSRVILNTIHHDGSNTSQQLYNQTNTIGGGDWFHGNVVTDVVYNNNAIYIVKNEPVGAYSGTAVRKLEYDNGSWQLDFSFGNNGFWTSSNFNGAFQFSRATIESNAIVIYGQSGSPLQQIGRIAILYNGQGDTFSSITQNTGQHFSFVGDVVTVDSDTYIADNGYEVNGNGDYTPITRIAKISMGSLATSYGVNGYHLLNWSNQTAGLLTSRITQLLPASDGKLLTIGCRYEYNPNPPTIWFPRGRISRVNADGTLDNSFGSSGIFDIDNLHARNIFNGAIEVQNGFMIVGSTGPLAVAMPTGMVLQISQNGALNTNLGTNGIIRFSPNEISDALSIFNRQDGRWIINGLQNTSGEQIGVGLYSFGTTASVFEYSKENTIQVNPNPTSSMLHIELTESTGFTIYNSLGELVFDGSNSESQTIDVSHLPSGIYLIREGETIQRFIKQ